MAFIDAVKWDSESNDIYAWKYPETNLSTATQLIVKESQEAVFFSKGQIIGKYGPGKHTLSTENLPLLRKLYGIPFGGVNPFTAEVWFVNKVQPLTIDWQTTSMRFMDPMYGAMVPLTARGRYGLKVKDAEKFLVKLVGSLKQFTSRELTDHFMGPLIAKTNSNIISYMNVNQISITQITAYLDMLSTYIGQPMSEFWEEYGFELTGFFITSVDIDTSSQEGKKISEAISDRSAQNIAGYTWQQKQSFGMAESALTKGGNMGMLGAMMMTGMFGKNSSMEGMMRQPEQSGFNAQPKAMQLQTFEQPMNRRKDVYCSNCGKKFPATNKFCPFCGDPNTPCPVCGADNPVGARRCVSCGAILTQMDGIMNENTCPRCGEGIIPGTVFCPNCGNKL